MDSAKITNLHGKGGAKGNRTLLKLIITAVFAVFYFYFKLPALNLRNTGLYSFVLVLAIVYSVLTLAFAGSLKPENPAELPSILKSKCKVPVIIALAMLGIIVLGQIISAPIFFHADEYSALLKTETGDFAEEIDEISFDQIPMLDKNSANVLANRKLGELSDLVSQFEVFGDSFQINYQGRPVRVTYLNYGDFFKWLNNRKSGIPAYMVVDMVSQEVTVQRLESGIRYSPSEYFFRDIERFLRFKYPTKMFADINFEVNEDGEPFWVASVVSKKIGLFGGEDIVGTVLVNASTGESQSLSIADVPTWVDRAYTADLIIQQYDYYGAYHNGWFNSIFGQSGCTETTSGYNYIAMSDDVWVYTGVTSVTGDQGNIGFLLVNQRTKDANYYSCAGAEEYSAMNSAEGAVQQYNYNATFPLLLNIGGQPTYFIALKDASNLVKMYAMVNVQQYQIVTTGRTVAECEESYLSLLAQNNIITGEDQRPPDVVNDTAEGVIADIRTAVIDGNTCCFIMLEGNDYYYIVSVADSALAAVLDVGDAVVLEVSADEGELRSAYGVERAA